MYAISFDLAPCFTGGVVADARQDECAICSMLAKQRSPPQAVAAIVDALVRCVVED